MDVRRTFYIYVEQIIW
ncbi:Ubiquitin carboxyl-terminal hydrolase, partial [Zea mays]